MLLKKISRSLYFLPALITLASIALAILLLFLDKSGRATYPIAEHWWNDASSARDFFSTSASVMITIASVSFSVVVVALTLASNQFCPRVLRRFIEDRMNRVVFGVLIGNFAFAMVGLSCIQEDQTPLPGLTLSTCFLFNLVSTALFIYFIHYISSSLQVDSIVRTTREETLRRIEKLKSSSQELDILGPADTSPQSLEDMSLPSACPIAKIGYVQAVRAGDLLALSEEMGESIRSRIGLGDFVTPESPCLHEPGFPLNEELEERIRDCYEVDYLRVLEHDIAYGFREIIDIALKAISPAINDPTTAVMCVQNMTAMFEALCKNGWPATELRVQESEAAVLFSRNQPKDYLSFLSDQLIYHCAGSPRVSEALLEMFAKFAGFLEGESWKEMVVEKSRLVVYTAAQGSLPPFWQERLKRSQDAVEKICGGPTPSSTGIVLAD